MIRAGARTVREDRMQIFDGREVGDGHAGFEGQSQVHRSETEYLSGRETRLLLNPQAVDECAVGGLEIADDDAVG